jgi:Spy/CpxP family protein refolding chaperone
VNRVGALAAVFGLFVLGVLAGALGVHLFYAHALAVHRPPEWVGRGPLAGALSRRLDLTSEQQDQLREILIDARRESDLLRGRLRPEVEAQMEKTRQRIEAILTPEQKRRFERMRSAHRHWAERMFLEPPPPPDDWPPPERRFHRRHRR